MANPLRRLTTDRPSLSIGIIFAINSIVFSSWYTRIPEVQTELGLNVGQLGLALLGVPLGSLLIIPITSWLIAKYSPAKITLVSAIGCCLIIATPAFTVNLWELSLTMVFLGVCNGSMDIAMNAQATAIETRRQVPILSTCHALFSFGGLLGGAVGGIIVTLRVSPQLHLMAIAFLMIGLVLWCSKDLRKFPHSNNTEPLFALPSKPLLGLAVMASCILLGEGAIGDWSAVYLRNTLHAAPILAGSGFACFSLGMTIGRLYGDQTTTRFGPKLVVRCGTLLAAIGLAIGLLLGHPFAGVLGFGCVGLGYAAIVPILFRTATNLPGMAPGTNIAAVASAGYTGFLIGPPLIGFVAEVVGLRTALGIIVFLAVLVNFMASNIQERVRANDQ